MIVLLLILLFVAGAVWIIGRSGRGDDHQRSGAALGRVLRYLFLVVAALSAASGVTRVVTSALPIAQPIAGPGQEELALGLALTLVAVPVWTVLWRTIGRRLTRDPGERASREWSVYIAVVMTTSLTVALVNLVRVGSWAIGAQDLEARFVAAALVWGTAWAGHAALARRPVSRPTRTRPDLAVLGGSAVGVVALALGADGVVSYGLGEAYRAVTGGAVVGGTTTEAVRRSLVLLVLAAVVWWWHWLRQALQGPRSTPWHVYVLLVPVLGGLLVAVGFATAALNAVVQWFIGEPEASRAAVHLAGLPDELAAVAVGGWVWWYHLAVVDRVAGRARGEPERTYEYVAAAVGLVAAAGGATAAISAAIEAAAPAPMAAGDALGRNALALALTLLLIGLPVWWGFWRRVQRRVRAGDVAELRSTARRSYLFLSFGVAGLTAAISLVVILFVALRDLLERSLDATVVHELRVAVALVLTTGAVSAYHWTVHSEDRAARPTTAHAARRHVLLVAPDGQALAAAITDRTGATVRTLHRQDIPPGRPDTDAVVSAILASPSEHLVVTVDGEGGVEAIPYEPG